MGDLRLMHFPSCSPSSTLVPPFSTASPKVWERDLLTRDHRHIGVGRIITEPCRSLCSSSHSQRKLQWRALLNDQGLPYSFFSGDNGPPFKEEEEMGILDRLALAWKVLFPKRKKVVTPAEMAKQRLKMILISDRCSVNDVAKRKIVNNIVGALANFVEIESQDRVRLNVSADPDLGTVYSVSVPVRRVKPEYQDNGEDVKDEEFRHGETETLSLMGRDFELPVGYGKQSETSLASSQEEDGGCISSAAINDAEG